MPTMKDVAKMANVSTATVSRVTRGVGYVASDTKLRVLDAIAQLHFIPSLAAVELGQRSGNAKARKQRFPYDTPHSVRWGAGHHQLVRSLRKEIRSLKEELAEFRADVRKLCDP